MLQPAEQSVNIYLPVHFRKEDNVNVENETYIKSWTGCNSGVSRITVLEVLQKSVEISLKELIQCALEGFTCKSSDEAEILFYVLLTSYVADIP